MDCEAARSIRPPIGAKYRAACRAKSTAEMINKTKIVEEASDETEYWLELWAEAGFISESQITEMDKATDETLRNLKS